MKPKATWTGADLLDDVERLRIADRELQKQETVPPGCFTIRMFAEKHGIKYATAVNRLAAMRDRGLIEVAQTLGRRVFYRIAEATREHRDKR